MKGDERFLLEYMIESNSVKEHLAGNFDWKTVKQ
jgi:hypothetical protein